MANKMVANIKSLTSGVGDLTKKVNELFAALDKVNGVASKALASTSSAVNSTGGQYNLTKGSNRPGTGADGAKFSALQNMAYGAAFGGGFMPNSQSGFGYLAASRAAGGSPGFGIAQGVLGMASGAMQSIPGLSDTMTRTYGYYQAGLKTPGINRNQLERATFSALRGGLSGVGADAQAAATLAGMGYAPGSTNYLLAMGQVGGAYKYLGMSNQAAAQAIGGMTSGPMAANLFQYGISTIGANGKDKSMGQIAREYMNVMTGGVKPTVTQVQESYRKGALGANLRTSGFSQDQQSMLYQAMIDIASGRNPDLQNAKPVKGNENTFLTAQGRINAATTKTMMTAEDQMIKGFENAATTVEQFNKALQPVIPALARVTGYTGGVSGSQIGKGAGKFLKGAATTAGAVISAFGAPEVGVPIMLAAGALGGSSSGYGAAFGVGNRGRSGGGSPVAGAAIAAGFGATDNSGIWSSTNNKHNGVDFAVPVGTPVKSTNAGTVSQLDLNKDYGQSILIDNADGTQAVYAHLSQKNVKVGDKVKQGQLIGKSGASGNAAGPHLHYELRDAKNHAVDPYASSGNYATTRATGVGLLGDSSTSSSSSAVTPLGQSMSIGAYKGGKGSLSDSALRDVLSSAGFKGSALENAMAVARAESGGRPGALNPNAGTGDLSMGLFQINMIGDLGKSRNAKYLKEYGQYGYTGPESLYKPDINARIAYDISKSGTKWSDAWVNTSAKLGLGGGSSGYGSAVHSPAVASGNRTVNVTLKIDRATEHEAMQFAKKVKYYLDHEDETRMIGNS